MRAPLLGLVAAGVLTGSARPAAALDAPKGRMALVGGIRANLGELGDRYAFGSIYGTEAAYHPNGSAFGFAWWLLFGRYVSSNDVANAEGTLGITQLGLGLRARIPVAAAAPTFVVLQAGGELVRTTIPVPPDEERIYAGPSGALGLELAQGSLSLQATIQYGVVFGGPAGAALLIGIGVGSR